MHVHELSEERVGSFDVVLFLGVFYHLFNPIDGLKRAAKLAREVLIIESHLDLLDLGRPGMVFYPGSECAGIPRTGGGPSGIHHSSFGDFRVCEDRYASGRCRGRAVFQAWRSEKRRRPERLRPGRSPP